MLDLPARLPARLDEGSPMAEKPALLPAYLIVGPDELKRRQAVARLRARVDGPFAIFNLEEIVASGDLEPVELLSSLNTLPMGGDRRVVVVEAADKLPKAVSEAVIDYLRRGDTLHLLHTGVPSRFEGQGIAAELTEAVLTEIRAQGLRIAPECSYIARYIERHPEWRQLVAGRS